MKTADIHYGLKDIYYDVTHISKIDTEQQFLLYRGINIEDLYCTYSFEEIVHLIVCGYFVPSKEISDCLRAVQKKYSLTLIDFKKKINFESTLHETIVSTFLFWGGTKEKSLFEDTIYLIYLVATALAFKKTGTWLTWTDLDPLRALFTVLSPPENQKLQKQCIDPALILLMEHGSNASTFCARVSSSAGASLAYNLTAAYTAFIGPKHGGAIQAVYPMVMSAHDPNSYIASCRSKNVPIYGFGHRVYKKTDPRASLFKKLARQLVDQLSHQHAGQKQRLVALNEKYENFESAMKPYQKFGIAVNVDYYASLYFSLLKIPLDFHTNLFALARIAGWIAHSEEQRQNPMIIRPRLLYKEAS